MALAVNPLHKVLMLPGQYDGREGLIHGPDTIDALQRLPRQQGVSRRQRIDRRKGPNDAGMGPGLIYGAMMRRSAETVILADHSKFDRPSLAVYGQWSRAATLVSDAAPAGDLAEALAAAGARLLTPQPVV